MKVLSLFSGIGAFEKALGKMGVDYELVGFSEIDKHASKSYCAVHGVEEVKNLGDITTVNEKELSKEIDLITYGFPCQDISLSGKQKGLFNEDGTQTRSGLFFEALRIIEETKPKVAIAENVKNLTSKKFKEQFQIVLDSLEATGYNNYWQVLNAKDYGAPQNRERVFIVSIRKDIDTGMYSFPASIELKTTLRNMLEENVDEKYYLSDKMIDYVCATGTKNFYYEPEIDLDIARPLTATMHKMHRASTDNYVSDEYIKNNNKVIIVDGERRVLVREATKQGYTEAHNGDSINLEQPNSKTRRGRVGKQVAQTLTTSPQQVVVEQIPKIRKLTPLECWRLMGFDDTDFYKAERVCSNTQLYKQAGNSVVVNVLEAIFNELRKSKIFLNKKF